MVDPKDLALGNWLLLKDGRFGLVTELSGDLIRIEVKQWTGAVPPEDLAYVPLTPGLMKYIGWHEDSLPAGVQYNEFKGPLSWSVRFWSLETAFRFETWMPGDISFWQIGRIDSAVRIQYLHELQQEYRRRTRKDLIIEL